MMIGINYSGVRMNGLAVAYKGINRKQHGKNKTKRAYKIQLTAVVF